MADDANTEQSASVLVSRDQHIAAIEERVIDAERELRSIRAALAAVTRCTCPVGFGSEPDHRCPKHGSRS